jgi:DUF2075 family protein/SOS-response transcriptional repressor LexA
MSAGEEFEIDQFLFNSNINVPLSKSWYAEDLWPIVYLLSETTSRDCFAYVGETTDALARFYHHINNAEKKNLTDACIITSNKYNKSATLNLEANLIKYLDGDGRFKLLNANIGLAHHNFFQKKEVYDPIFRSVWDNLRSLGIAQHPLEFIDNSDLFKYSPYKSLSPDQTQALMVVLRALLKDQYKNVFIEGGAGTGKSILAVFLFKLLNTPLEDFNFIDFGAAEMDIFSLVSEVKEKYPNPRMALVVPMASFRKTVQRIFGHVKGLNSKMVVGPAELGREHYDIVLVDEAHRLRRRANLGAYFGVFDQVTAKLGFDKMLNSELDWVTKQSNKAILFYDEGQSIKPSDTDWAAFNDLKNKPDTQTQTLNTQFRVKGGIKYVRFLGELLSASVPKGQGKISFKEYEFLLFYGLDMLVSYIKEKNNKYKLARMAAGYAWPWVSKRKPNEFDIHLQGLQLRWNSKNEEWIHSANAIDEIGCIHTLQGYDLNYTGIIFGPEIGYDNEKGEIIIREEHYHDRNGKDNIKSPGQLKKYILHIYKTLMLRGIKGTYVFVCDEALREFFARYIPSFEDATLQDTDLRVEISIVPFGNSVPLFNLKAAAGGFSDLQQVDEQHSDWVLVPESVKNLKECFACQVKGESMNRIIPNNSICLFRRYGGGSRNGKIVLVQYSSLLDSEFGSNYTVKEYHSKKILEADGAWAHEEISLKPLSNDLSYQPILLKEDQLRELRVVGVFECVLI